MTLKKMRTLQAQNSSLLRAIEINTIIMVDGLVNNRNLLLDLACQQVDVENQLIDMIACFQAIEYRPQYDGINADFSA